MPINDKIAERRLRDNEARKAKIVDAARRIAEIEGWTSVTIRRLADEIEYSQPVLYGHFGSREGILAAVAIDGFRELGMILHKIQNSSKPGCPIEKVAVAYLKFAATSPAQYEVMFSLNLNVSFDDATTPPEVRFAFSQILSLFDGSKANSEQIAELFWASLHGVADLSRTKRFAPRRQKERVKTLVKLFKQKHLLK